MKQIKQNSPTTDLLGCIRRLSNVERLFLWSFQTNIAVSARIGGYIEEEKLEQAIDMVCRMHPLTRCRITFNEIHVAYWEKYRYSIALLQLEPEEGHDLAARCRENSVTIGSAMAAAFLAAYYEVIGPLPKNKRTVSTPFDLRRHFKEGNIDGFCFLSGGFNFPFVYDQKKTFWRNAADLHRIIQGRVKALDNWGLDMESFNPTLIDASELS